jgi:hypothetical protein
MVRGSALTAKTPSEQANALNLHQRAAMVQATSTREHESDHELRFFHAANFSWPCQLNLERKNTADSPAINVSTAGT